MIQGVGALLLGFLKGHEEEGRRGEGLPACTPFPFLPLSPSELPPQPLPHWFALYTPGLDDELFL